MLHSDKTSNWSNLRDVRDWQHDPRCSFYLSGRECIIDAVNHNCSRCSFYLSGRQGTTGADVIRRIQGKYNRSEVSFVEEKAYWVSRPASYCASVQSVVHNRLRGRALRFLFPFWAVFCCSDGLSRRRGVELWPGKQRFCGSICASELFLHSC